MAKESSQVNLLVSEYVCFAAATVFITLRLVSRRLTKLELWYDDYFAICSYTVATSYTILIPFFVKYGMGLHMNELGDLSVEDSLYYNLLLLWIGEHLYAFTLFFGKISILCFYWRMFRVSSIKVPVQILLGCAGVWIIIRTFMGIFLCVPVHAFWDKSVPNATCNIDNNDFFIGTVTVHALMDFIILCLPMIEVRKLQLPRTQKLSVMAMFTFGFFICAAATVIVVEAVRFNRQTQDLTWDLCVIIIWATVEVNLVSVSICLPTIRPALMVIFGRRGPRSTIRSGSDSYGHSQASKKAVRLSNFRHSTDGDETGSTYQLASSVGEAEANGGFENHALDRARATHTATVQGPASTRSAFPTEGNGQGIMVKNETSVKVSKAKQRREETHRDDSSLEGY